MWMERSRTVRQPVDAVWSQVGDPAAYARRIDGCERFEAVDDAPLGEGKRYAYRLVLGRTVLAGQAAVAVRRAGAEIAVHGPDLRVRWWLRPAGEQTYVRIGLACRTAVFDGSVLDRTLDRLDPALPERTLLDRAGDQLHGGMALLRSGILKPVARPDRSVKRALAVLRWGLTPVAGYTAAAVACPHRPAVIDDDGAVTFDELDRTTTRLANILLELGVRAGDPVAICCRNHRGMVQAVLAAGKAGAHALLLNTSMSPAQAATVLAARRPAAVIADGEFDALLADAPTTPRLSTEELPALIEAAPDTPLPAPDRPGRIMVLTSGTTGAPKGAYRPDVPVGLAPAAAVLGRLPYRAEQAHLVAPPLFHTWGLANFQLAAALRSTLVLQRKFDPEQALAAVAEHRVAMFAAVPIMLRRILDLPDAVRTRYDTGTLRMIATSGSALPGPLATAVLREYGPVLHNLYGSTEASWVSIASPADLLAAPGTAGRPPRGTRLAILDEEGRPLPDGEVGRIFVGNPMLFEGYASGEPAKETRHGMLATGDVGRIDAAGRLWVTGRDDDMIVSGGENVYPGEVEDVLAALPGVREVAVVGMPDEDFGQRLVAYVVGDGLTADDVKAAVRARLAGFSVPREVVFLDALPRNATGKVVRRDLPR